MPEKNNTQTISENKKGEDKKNKKKKTAKKIIAVIVIVIIILLLFHYCALKRTASLTNSGDVISGDLPGMTQSEIENALKKKQDASRFTMQADSSGYIKKGSKRLHLRVANPAENTASCQIEIMEGNTVLFGSTSNGKNKQITSKIMRPKTYMTTFELNRTLSPGSHKLIVRYNIIFQNKSIGVSEIETKVLCQ